MEYLLLVLMLSMPHRLRFVLPGLLAAFGLYAAVRLTWFDRIGRRGA